MKLIVIAVGQRLPEWVNAGVEMFQKRFPPHMPLKIIEIPTQNSKTEEGLLMEKAIPKNAHVVTLSVTGNAWTSEGLGAQLEGWKNIGQDIVFLIGGADGLTDNCLARSKQDWSLSKLTLPHSIARLLVVEQLYRAHTIITNHPYHRA